MTQIRPTAVAACSKQADLRPLVCWDSGLKSHRGMDVCVSWVLCVVRDWSLRRADHSSRAVLQTVVCLPEFDPENLKWGGLGPLDMSSHKKKRPKFRPEGVRSGLKPEYECEKDFMGNWFEPNLRLTIYEQTRGGLFQIPLYWKWHWC